MKLSFRVVELDVRFVNPPPVLIVRHKDLRHRTGQGLANGHTQEQGHGQQGIARVPEKQHAQDQVKGLPSAG